MPGFVGFARESVKAFASIFWVFALLVTGLWAVILVVGVLITVFSGDSLAWSDLLEPLLYLGLALAFIAIVLAIVTPFSVRSDRRTRRELEVHPLLEPIALSVDEDAIYVLERRRPRLSCVRAGEVTEVPVHFAVGGAMSAPRAVVAAPKQTIFVADPLRETVIRVPEDHGDATSISVAPSAVPVAMTLDHVGNLLVADANGGRLFRMSPDGEAELVAERLHGVRGIGAARDGAVIVSDKFGHRILRVSAEGEVSLVAGTGEAGFGGDGGDARKALLAGPTGVAVAPDGSVYVADTGNERVRRIDPQGVIGTVAGSGLAGFSGDGGPARAATLSSPSALAFAHGRLYIADTGNSRVRAVSAGGVIETVAGAAWAAPR